MRKKMLLLTLALAATAAAWLSPVPASARACVTYCSTPNPCGYVCCYRQCCGRICVDLDCAPPPPCGALN